MDRESRRPLYVQLERAIRQAIADGAYQPGDLLPSESRLSAIHEVSRTVVRRALDRLATDGLIRKEQGRGSVVAGYGRRMRRNVQHSGGLFEEFRKRGLDVTTQLVFKHIVEPPDEVAEFFGSDRTWRIDRVRSVDGQVVAYVRTFLPIDRCGDLDQVDLETRSLYAYLKDECGLAVTSGQRLIEATGAEGTIAEALKVSEGAPVLLLKSAGLAGDGSPIEWFQSWHRSDRAVFEIDILDGVQAPLSGLEDVMRLDHRPDLLQFAREARRRPSRAGVTADATRFDAEGAIADAELTEAIRRERLIARLDSHLGPGARATASVLVDSGIRILDVHVAAKPGTATLEAAASEEGLIVGASGVRTARQAEQARDAGARYLVAPLAALEELRAAVDLPVLPIGVTPSELWTAQALGAATLILHSVCHGGQHWLEELVEDLGDTTIVASGGIDVARIPVFLASAAHAVRLAPPFGIATSDRARASIEQLARRAVVLASSMAS